MANVFPEDLASCTLEWKNASRTPEYGEVEMFY
jgi:hypothetical protein